MLVLTYEYIYIYMNKVIKYEVKKKKRLAYFKMIELNIIYVNFETKIKKKKVIYIFIYDINAYLINIFINE
jgi:hypothetical protein